MVIDLESLKVRAVVQPGHVVAWGGPVQRTQGRVAPPTELNSSSGTERISF